MIEASMTASERLFPKPETLPEVNYLADRILGENISTLFIPGKDLSRKGRAFVGRNYTDLYARHAGDWLGIKREIDEASLMVKGKRRGELIDRFRGRFDFEVAYAAAKAMKAESDSLGIPLKPVAEWNRGMIFSVAWAARKQYSQDIIEGISDKEEVFLVRLKELQKALLSVELKKLDEEIDLLVKKNFATVTTPESLKNNLTKNYPEPQTPPEFLPRRVELWTKPRKKLKVNPRKLFTGVIGTSALVLLYTYFNSLSISLSSTVSDSEFREPQKAADTFSGVASFAVAGNSQKPGEASALQTVASEKQGLSVTVSGAPTVYAKGVWEQVFDRRLKGAWVNKGIKGKEKYYPPLNRELADNSQIAALIKNHQVLAVNPADFNLEYRQLSQRLVTSAKKQGLSDEATAKTLNANPGLRKMAESLIGQIVYVKLPNGNLKEMVIMDTASNSDAFRLSSINSRFIADFDPDFLKRELSLEWVAPTKNKPGYFRDLKTGQQATSFPDISLFS